MSAIAPVIGVVELRFAHDLSGLWPATATSGAIASAERGGLDLGNRLGGAMRGLIAPATIAAVVALATRAVGVTVRAAGALEQSVGAMNTVFKGSEKQMGEWSKGASTSVGLASNDYNNLAVLLGSQLKNAGTPLDTIAGKTNDLVTAGADMASMFGGTTKDAVEAISSALKGERDPIERYGVSLKQATIDAKAAEMGFTKVGGAFDAQAQSAATLALIMEQTGDAQGNFAKEATTYEGVMQRLGASWQNVSASIGQGFLPFATAAGAVLLGMMPTVQGLAENFEAFGAYMSDAFQEAGGGMAGIGAMFSTVGASIADFLTGGGLVDVVELTASLLPRIAAAAAGFLTAWATYYAPAVAAFYGVAADLFGTAFGQAIATVLPLLSVAAWTLVPVLVTALLGMLPPLLGAASSLFMGIVEAVGVVIPLIVAALVDAIPLVVAALLGTLPALIAASVALFTGIVSAIPDIIPPLIQAVVDLLPDLVGALISMLAGLVDAAVELFTGIVEAVPVIIPQLLAAVIDLLPQIVRTLIELIPALINGAVDLFVGIVRAIPKIVPQLITALLELGPEMIGTLLGLVPDLLQAGVDLIGGLVAGLWDSAAAVGEALLGMMGSAVDGFLSFLGIHSPSRVTFEAGRTLGAKLADDLHELRGNYLDALPDPPAAAPGSPAALWHEANLPREDAPRVTTYYDFGVSQEDKAAKLARAQDNLRATAHAYA